MTTVVIAPDKFQGSLTAPEVGEALALGLRAANPRTVIVTAPVADGGDGTAAALIATEHTPLLATVCGPTGQAVRTTIARHGRTAVVELADACGLGRLPGGRPDPWRAGTSGLGGSASTDGGVGLLGALGARILGADGLPVSPDAYGMSAAVSVDLTGLRRRMRGTDVVVASDVDRPLTGPQGSAAVFAAQKGANPREQLLLDAALTRGPICSPRSREPTIVRPPAPVRRAGWASPPARHSALRSNGAPH